VVAMKNEKGWYEGMTIHIDIENGDRIAFKRTPQKPLF
jgi:hypothetical protein